MTKGICWETRSPRCLRLRHHLLKRPYTLCGSRRTIGGIPSMPNPNRAHGDSLTDRRLALARGDRHSYIWRRHGHRRPEPGGSVRRAPPPRGSPSRKAPHPMSNSPPTGRPVRSSSTTARREARCRPTRSKARKGRSGRSAISLPGIEEALFHLARYDLLLQPGQGQLGVIGADLLSSLTVEITPTAVGSGRRALPAARR